jgi:NAD(P)-dependent dehydrogenase (short-subunit alcohol dehydrogenase family)
MLTANYLGPFLLTHLLTDRLIESKPSRIVITASEAHRLTGRFDPEDFEQLGGYTNAATAQAAYGKTKLLDLLWAEELAKRLEGTGVTVNSLCPGLVATELIRESGISGRMLDAMAKTPLVRRPDQGARVIVRLAADPSLEATTGRFFSSTPGARLVPTTGPRRDPTVAPRVYERTCELLGLEARSS